MTTNPTAKQDSREEVAREIEQIVITRDSPLNTNMWITVADYCIKYRNDGINEVLRNPRTYKIGSVPPYQYVLSESEMNLVLKAEKDKAVKQAVERISKHFEEESKILRFGFYTGVITYKDLEDFCDQILKELE